MGLVTDAGTVQIDNANIYYELAGEGLPVVLLHAGVADCRQWNNELAYFAQNYRVLRYDRRGYGKSMPVEGEFSHLRDLTALLSHLHLYQPLILIGCSMGGSLALDFALDSPARVKALVMVGSAPSGLYLDVPFNPLEADAEAASAAGDLERQVELETQMFFDGMGRTPQQVNQEMRRLAVEMNRLAHSHQALQLGKCLPDTNFKAADRLDEIKDPLLMVVGEYDEPYSHAAADYVVEHVPTASKVLIEDAAHLANMDQPEKFQQVVSAFLDRLSTET